LKYVCGGVLSVFLFVIVNVLTGCSVQDWFAQSGPPDESKAETREILSLKSPDQVPLPKVIPAKPKIKIVKKTQALAPFKTQKKIRLTERTSAGEMVERGPAVLNDAKIADVSMTERAQRGRYTSVAAKAMKKVRHPNYITCRCYATHNLGMGKYAKNAYRYFGKDFILSAYKMFKINSIDTGYKYPESCADLDGRQVTSSNFVVVTTEKIGSEGCPTAVNITKPHKLTLANCGSRKPSAGYGVCDNFKGQNQYYDHWKCDKKASHACNVKMEALDQEMAEADVAPPPSF